MIRKDYFKKKYQYHNGSRWLMKDSQILVNRSGIATILVVLIIVFVLSVGGAAAYYFFLQPSNEQIPAENKLFGEEGFNQKEESTISTNQNPEKESIADILAKAADVDSVQYDMVGYTYVVGIEESYSPNIEAKGWQKLPYMRFESTTNGVEVIMIIHPDAFYMYDKTKDIYIKLSTENLASMVAQKPLQELINEIRENQSLKELGTEIIDGKLTTIAEYIIPIGKAQVTQKMWLWNDTGLPLKGESTVSLGENDVKTITEYKNYVFDDIPDTMFEVPQDKIVELDSDSDNDGLMDQLEEAYGTDPNNPDTDGDGFLDGEEVLGGYNPLGEGKLKD